MSRFLNDPASALRPLDGTLDQLVYGWGNPWSGQTEYLRACISEVLRAPESVLECGSGLTTLLLGAATEEGRTHIVTLEHSAAWASRLQRRLDRYRIRTVRVVVTPLVDYGDCWWYERTDQFPRKVDLVVCDGPPHDTPGGRAGLVSAMRNELTPDVIILLDDAARSDEAAIAKRWARELPATLSLHGVDKPFFRLTRNH